MDSNMDAPSLSNQQKLLLGIFGEHETTKKKLDDTQEDLSKAQKDLSKAQEDLSKAQKDLNKTHEDFDKAQKDLAKTQEDYGKSQEDLDKTRKDLSKAQEDLSKAQEDFDKAQKDLAKTQEDLGKSQEDLSKAQKDLSKAQKDLNKAHEDFDKAQKDLAKTQKDLDKAQKDLTKTQEDLVEAQDELKLVKQNSSTLESKNEQLYHELNSILEINGQQQNKLNNLVQMNLQTTEKWLKEIAELTKNLQAEKEEKEKIQCDYWKKSKELNVIVKVMEKNNSDLKKENLDLKKEVKVKSLEKEIQRQTEKSHFETEIRTRQKKMYELYEKVNSFEKEKTAIETAYKEEISQKNQEILKFEQEIMGLQIGNEVLVKDIKNEKNAKILLQQENSFLKKEINILKSKIGGLKMELIEAIKMTGDPEKLKMLQDKDSSLKTENKIQRNLIDEHEQKYQNLHKSFEQELKEKKKLVSDRDEKMRLITDLEFANSEIQRLNNHLQVLLRLKKEQDSQLARLCLSNETVSDKEKSFYEWKIKEFEIQLEHVRNCKGECRAKKAIVATQETQTEETTQESDRYSEASLEEISAARVYERDARTDCAETENGESDNGDIHGPESEAEMTKIREENVMLTTLVTGALNCLKSKKCVDCVERTKVSDQKEKIYKTTAPSSSTYIPPSNSQPPHITTEKDPKQSVPFNASMQETLQKNNDHNVPLKLTEQNKPNSRKRPSSPINSSKRIFKPPPVKFSCGNLKERFARFINNVDTTVDSKSYKAKKRGYK